MGLALGLGVGIEALLSGGSSTIAPGLLLSKLGAIALTAEGASQILATTQAYNDLKEQSALANLQGTVQESEATRKLNQQLSLLNAQAGASGLGPTNTASVINQGMSQLSYIKSINDIKKKDINAKKRQNLIAPLFDFSGLLSINNPQSIFTKGKKGG